jgi:hypothetical protein
MEPLNKKLETLHIEEVKKQEPEIPETEFRYHEHTSNLSRQKRRQEAKKKNTLALKEAAKQETLGPDNDPQILEERAFKLILQPLNMVIYNVRRYPYLYYDD